MNLKSLLIIFQKEMRDILRDRRTLISMILVPILIFPVLMVGSGLFMKSRIDKIKDKVSRVAWIAPLEADYLKEPLTRIEGLEILPGTLDSVTAISMVQDKEIEAVVIVPPDFAVTIEQIMKGDDSFEAPNISIYLNETRTQSDLAVTKISAILQDYRSSMTREALIAHDVSPQLAQPFWIARNNIASPEQMGRFLASSFLPYVLILMALTGAMYPAIDLTAGEKERGTLETLLVSGVSRVDIVLGKFCTVFTASMLTAVLSVASMALTSAVALNSFPEVASKLQFSLGLREILLTVLAMIPLTAIFSSILMTVSIFAKSYREAQTYVSPLMMLVIFPAMASIMPDSETSSQMALVPILNVSLMLKDSITGTINMNVILITMAVNLVLAAIGLVLVLRMFRRETVLFRI